MGRKLNPLKTKIHREESEEFLSVIYRYRGSHKGWTDFLLNSEDGDQKALFSLISPNDALDLAHYLESEIAVERGASPSIPSYEITGYALKVFCNDNVIKTIYDHKVIQGVIDTITYQFLNNAFPEYSSNDYYFVIYGLKDHGMSRQTIETIIESCIKYQKAVIISGDLRVCRPMIQRDIALNTGFDITAVSRATREVRIFTCHRNYSLDSYQTSLTYPSLFNEGLTVNGSRISTFGIREKILALIETEHKSHPLTDESISAELKRYGYSLARRTVAKYRKALGLPDSNARRIK